MHATTTLLRFASLLVCGALCFAGCNQNNTAEIIEQRFIKPDAIETIRVFNDKSVLDFCRHAFTISANQEWLVTILEGPTFELMNIPTQRTWQHPAVDSLCGDISRFYPNSFTMDQQGQKLYWGVCVSKLSANMSAWRFSNDNQGAKNGNFLEAWQYQSPIIAPPICSMPSGAQIQDTWAAGKKIHYEVVHDKSSPDTLRISPPGTIRPIVYKALLDIIAADKLQIQQELKNIDKQAKDFAQVLLLIKSATEGKEVIELEDITVSPDRKFLAAKASLRSFINSISYGILIPLESNTLEARPFSRQIYGQMLWSHDSQALYFFKSSANSKSSGIYRINMKKI